MYTSKGREITEAWRQRATTDAVLVPTGGAVASELNLEKLRLWVAFTIVVLWVVSIIADAIPALGYDPPATLHALMVMTATFLFGPSMLGRTKATNGNGNGGTKDLGPSPTPEEPHPR
jgi:hypothetical protein